MDTIGERLSGAAAGDSHVTLPGRTLRPDAPRAEAGGPGAGGYAPADPGGAGPGWGGGHDAGAATGGAGNLSAREALRESAFQLGLNEAGAGAWTAWGRVSGKGFEGREGALSLDGEVTSGWLGFDRRLGAAALAGLAVSHAAGDGGFGGLANGAGKVKASLTTAYPYLGWSPSDGVELWGMLGLGLGELTLTDEIGQVETDIEMRMGALGGRADLPSVATVDLALKADAFAVRMDTGPNLRIAGADARRARLVLAGARAFTLASGARLMPSLEAGIRHDGGDAETGLGIELGGGLRYEDPAAGLTVEGSGWALAAHRDDDYRDHGMSGLIRLDPGADGRGLSFTLRPSRGVAWSGAGRFRPRSPADPATGDGAGARLDAVLGYGQPGPAGRGLLTPSAGFGWSDDGARDWRLGWRFAFGLALELSLEGERREHAAAAPDHGIMLGVGLRW